MAWQEDHRPKGGRLTDFDEPRIVYTVRDLLREQRDEINAALREISDKLDDRVTVAVFRALRSDLDAAIRRLSDAEGEIGQLQEAARAEALARDVAARTLARETERRRLEAEAVRKARAEALEAPVRTWTLRVSKVSVVSGLIAIAAGLYGLYRLWLATKGVVHG
jgi:uncharacterized membrane protein YccC